MTRERTTPYFTTGRFHALSGQEPDPQYVPGTFAHHDYHAGYKDGQNTLRWNARVQEAGWTDPVTGRKIYDIERLGKP